MPAEQEYIRKEGRKQMEQWSHLSDPQAVAAKIEEGEARLQIAQHYKIPYPRLHHASQFEKVPYVQAPQLPGAEAPVPHSSDPDTDAKLAAAARRRQERLAQQRRQLEEELRQQEQEGGPDSA